MMMFNFKMLVFGLIVGFQLITVVRPYCFQGYVECEPNFSGLIDCNDCSCNSAGTYLSCCFNPGRPVRMTPGCKTEFNSDTCEYEVFNPDNPDAECHVFASVGR